MLKKVNEKTVLTETSYNFGKNLVTLYIPAVSSLYFGLSAIWGLPDTQQIVGTLALVATFLGVVLHISTSNFQSSGAAYDGNVVVTKPDGGGVNYSLELNGDPADIQHKDKVAFKVVNPSETDTETVSTG